MKRESEVLVIPKFKISSILDGYNKNKVIDLEILLSESKFVSEYDAAGTIVLSQIIFILLFKNSDNKYLACSYINKDKKRIYSLGICRKLYNDYDCIINRKEYINKILDKNEIDNITYKDFKFSGYIKNNLNSPNYLYCLFIVNKNISLNNKNKIEYEWLNVKELIDKYYKFNFVSRCIIDDYVLE